MLPGPLSRPLPGERWALLWKTISRVLGEIFNLFLLTVASNGTQTDRRNEGLDLASPIGSSCRRVLRAWTIEVFEDFPGRFLFFTNNCQ